MTADINTACDEVALDFLYSVDRASRHKFLSNNQPDALIHVFIYSFYLSICLEHQVLIIRRSNCIITSLTQV